VIRPHLYNGKAIRIDHKEVLLAGNKEPSDFRFPQLEVLEMEYEYDIVLI